MRHPWFLIAVLLVGGTLSSATAQPGRVATAVAKGGPLLPPPAVQSAFAQRFPTATAVAWEMEGALYEAEFKDAATKVSALFAATGALTEVERVVPLSALPAAVLPYLEKHYPAKPKIKEAARIEDAAGTITWEVEIGKKDVFFSATGAFLREEAD